MKGQTNFLYGLFIKNAVVKRRAQFVFNIKNFKRMLLLVMKVRRLSAKTSRQEINLRNLSENKTMATIHKTIIDYNYNLNVMEPFLEAP
jgi:hypothetical protein